MLIAVAKVSAALIEAEIDAMPCVTVHDELVVEAAEDVADQAAAILERGMREGFEQVFGHLSNYDDVARFVVGSVERGPTWGGKRFDPQALSEDDSESCSRVSTRSRGRRRGGRRRHSRGIAPDRCQSVNEG